jgi:hypothetical protein
MTGYLIAFCVLSLIYYRFKGKKKNQEEMFVSLDSVQRYVKRYPGNDNKDA